MDYTAKGNVYFHSHFLIKLRIYDCRSPRSSTVSTVGSSL